VSHDLQRVCLSFLLAHNLFELGVVKLPCTTDLRLLATKMICSKIYVEAAALSAPMIFLYCSFAPQAASFTFKNPLSLYVDNLNVKLHTIRRDSLIATPSSRLSQK